MAQPFAFIGSGYYTSDAAAEDIPLSDRPDYFMVEDRTNWGAQNTAATQLRSWWRRDMAAGSYLQISQPSSTGTGVTLYASQGTSGGFTFIDQSNPPTFANVAVTAVSGTTTWVALTGTTTGMAVGDLVRLINIASMQQFSGPILYEVTAVDPGVSLTLGYAATAKTAGMVVAVDGTTGFYKKVYPNKFYPALREVAHITQAAQAKVYFFRKNDFTVGEMVDFQIPSSYGMVQMSNLTRKTTGPARVLTVTNSATESSIVLDLDSSGFTAFAAPATADFAGGASPATCFPAGSGVVPFNGSATIPLSPPGTNLLDAFDNRNQLVMNVGTSVVGASESLMYWEAWRADYFNGISNA